jgi:hypothetical protein
MLHRCPYPAIVDQVHTVEVLSAFFGGVGEWNHDAGVVEGHVEPAERGCGLVDHGRYLIFGGDVAGEAEDLVPGGAQLIGGSANGVGVDVGQNDGSAGLGEGLRGGQAHAGAGTGHQGDLAGEVVAGVHVQNSTAAESSAGMPYQYTFH